MHVSLQMILMVFWNKHLISVLCLSPVELFFSRWTSGVSAYGPQNSRKGRSALTHDLKTLQTQRKQHIHNESRVYVKSKVGHAYSNLLNISSV